MNQEEIKKIAEDSADETLIRVCNSGKSTTVRRLTPLEKDFLKSFQKASPCEQKYLLSLLTQSRFDRKVHDVLENPNLKHFKEDSD